MSAVITGPITAAGPVIELLVGVSEPRRRVMERNGFQVPEPVPVRALIDTGSAVTGFTASIFAALGLTPVGNIPISTPSTPVGSPHSADEYLVSFQVVANGIPHP